MKKYLSIIRLFLIFAIIIGLFIFSILYGIINIDQPFDTTGKLYFLMKDYLNIPIWIPFILLLCTVVIPFFFYKLFLKNGVKGWKAFIPIYNIYVLLGIIDIKKWLFSVALVLIPMYIIFEFLSRAFACQCMYSLPLDYDLKTFVHSFGNMPRYAGYNTSNGVFLFLSDLSSFIIGLYVIGFAILLFYRLFKYCSEQKKVLNSKTT